MKPLSIDITERFHKVIKGGMTLDTFEKWVYDSKDLETILGSSDYLELISLDYRKKEARHDLGMILKRLLGIVEYETYTMPDLLNEAKLKNERLPFILMEFYNRYCKGYVFLQDLGLGFGLMVVVPPSKYSKDKWDDLREDEKKTLLDSFSPELDEAIQRAIDWLTNKRIVLTGEQDKTRNYLFEDFRTDEERKLILWTPVADGLELKMKREWKPRGSKIK